MQTVDVVVVGAGPGGATAAWKCAEAGLNTVVLDRAAELPRYKPCGGGIPASLGNHVDGLDFEAFADLSITRLRHSWKGKSVVSAPMTRADGSPSTIWMVQRPRFDHWLVNQAVRSGASVHMGAKVALLEPDGDHWVVGDGLGNRWKTRYLVGADGAKGVVGPKVGLRLQKQWGIAREIEIPFETNPDSSPWHPKLEPDACYLDFGSVRNGYAWIFPKSGMLSVGAGMLLPSRPAANAEDGVGRVLLRAIESLLESVGLSLPTGVDAPRLWAHPIPFWTGAEPLQTADNRVVLVGDAAGLVQPLFGEGIQYAVRSGAVAAKSIVSGDTSGYTDAIREMFADEFDAAERVGRLFHRTPWLCYRVGVRNPAGTRLVGRLMAGDTRLVDIEARIRQKLAGLRLGKQVAG